MLNRFVLLMAIAIGFGTCSFAQSNCPPKNIYATKTLGDGKDSARMTFPLNFIITPDSVIISFDSAGKRQFAAFRILTRACFWNADFSEGRSEYNLLLYEIKGNMHPKLKIISDIQHPVYIELLYENGEKRIFMSL